MLEGKLQVQFTKTVQAWIKGTLVTCLAGELQSLRFDFNDTVQHRMLRTMYCKLARCKALFTTGTWGNSTDSTFAGLQVWLKNPCFVHENLVSQGITGERPLLCQVCPRTGSHWEAGEAPGDQRTGKTRKTLQRADFWKGF